MVYLPECSYCGSKIDLEEGNFVIDSKTGYYFCNQSHLDEFSDAENINNNQEDDNECC